MCIVDMGFQSAPLVGEGRKNGIERHHTDTKGFNPRPSWVRGERINRRVVLVPGSGFNPRPSWVRGESCVQSAAYEIAKVSIRAPRG